MRLVFRPLAFGIKSQLRPALQLRVLSKTRLFASGHCPLWLPKALGLFTLASLAKGPRKLAAHKYKLVKKF